MELKSEKKYVLRLDNKSYATFIKQGRNSRVREAANIHLARQFDSINEAMSYVKAINEKEKLYNKRIYSDYKVVEITEINYVPKITSRIKLQ